MRPTKAIIHRDALEHNLAVVKHHAPNSSIIAMVKADAYGHGIEHIVTPLQAADALGVACLEEAIALRRLGWDKTIILIEGFFAADELAQITQHNFECVVHCQEQLEILQNTRLEKPLTIWLKINSGMQRLGFRPELVTSAWQGLSSLPLVNLRCMTHFADASDLAKATTQQQMQQFFILTADFNVETSLANSAGILAWPQSHAHWVRPGIMLYGVSPFADKTGLEHDLKPAMTLQSELIAIQACQAGDAVGYGGDWICPEAMPVGVVAIGYGDGYPRHAANGTPVLVNGKQVPLVGRVSMDMLTIDLRSQANAKVGDRVVLWGEGLPAEIPAQHAGTIAYELLTQVTPRVPRKII